MTSIDIDKRQKTPEAVARREWKMYAFLGGATYLAILSLLYFVALPGAGGYLIILLTASPVVVISVVLKSTMLKRSKHLKDLLSKAGKAVAKDYASTYVSAMNTGVPSVIVAADKYKSIQLIWAALSIYNFSSIFAILIFSLNILRGN